MCCEQRLAQHGAASRPPSSYVLAQRSHRRPPSNAAAHTHAAKHARRLSPPPPQVTNPPRSTGHDITELHAFIINLVESINTKYAAHLSASLRRALRLHLQLHLHTSLLPFHSLSHTHYPLTHAQVRQPLDQLPARALPGAPRAAARAHGVLQVRVAQHSAAQRRQAQLQAAALLATRCATCLTTPPARHCLPLTALPRCSALLPPRSVADCVVVTATRDGMNLVPYEYIVCRQVWQTVVGNGTMHTFDMRP